MSVVPSLRMNNGLEIPQVGFGVFLVPPEETKQAVAEALKAGYRLIDTAQGYRNEEGVGAAIAESDVSRDELFITTKLTNGEQGYDTTLAAFDGSMEKLGLDVLDLFLIHWPQPMFDQYVEAWRAFEKLLAEGRVRSIGVSNFEIHHLTATPRRDRRQADRQPGRVAPGVSAGRTSRVPRRARDPHRVVVRSVRQGPAGEPHIVEVAQRKDRTPAQVGTALACAAGLRCHPQVSASRSDAGEHRPV